MCVHARARVTPDQAGLQKVAEKFKKYDFSALLLIGGFEVIYVIYALENELVSKLCNLISGCSVLQ